MGTGLEVALVGAMVGGTAYQIERGQSAAREQRKAAGKEEEARGIASAQQERERQLAIRQQAREERIRRAQIISAAEASGVSGSSVEASSIGSGQTIAAAGQAFATGASLANTQISSLSQQAANLRAGAAFDMAQGQIGGAIASTAKSAFMMGGFSSTPQAPGTPAGVHPKVGGYGAPSPTYGM